MQQIAAAATTTAAAAAAVALWLLSGSGSGGLVSSGGIDLFEQTGRRRVMATRAAACLLRVEISTLALFLLVFLVAGLLLRIVRLRRATMLLLLLKTEVDVRFIVLAVLLAG